MNDSYSTNNKEIIINKYTLKFNNTELENQFKDAYVSDSIKLYRASMILCVILFAVFGVLDIWMVPISIKMVWFIRFGIVVPFAVVVFLSTFFDFMKKYIQSLVFFASLISGFGIVVILMITKSEEIGRDYYYIGVFLMIMWNFSMSRLRIRTAVTSSVIITISYFYVIAFIYYQYIYNIEIFLSNVVFVISTNVIGIMGLYYFEFYYRKNFLKAKKIQRSNEKVIESINYAKTIQLSVLPLESELKSVFTDFFIIWKPKDIVGGDIYWFNKFKDGFIIAVIDCIGHGVPGALMAMTASSVLNRVTGEISSDNPAKILKEVNKHVRIIHNHHVENADLKDYDDGFDIGLCYVMPKEKKMVYAGAKIPLFICKDGKVQIIKADKQGIGYRRSKVDFEYTNNEINFEDGSTFYLTLDGYLDQQGEVKEFGMGKKGFTNIVIDNCNNSLQNQKEEFEKLLLTYMGNKKQTDDITVVGFKMS